MIFKNKKLHMTYSYNDVSLVPAYSELTSRSNTDPSMHSYKMPIMASCMDTLGVEIMKECTANKVPFICHRAFNSAAEQFNYFMTNGKGEVVILKNYNTCIWFAVGSVQKYKDWIIYLYNKGIRRFCVDMAHGDSLACINTIKFIKNYDAMQKQTDNSQYTPLGFENIPVHVIAGNVATIEGFKRLQKAGADGVRVGIASGSICFTPNTKVWFLSKSGSIHQKEIQHITVGEKVLTAEGRFREVTEKLVNVYHGEVYQINDITATPTHPFLTYNINTHVKEYISIKDIDPAIHKLIDSDGKMYTFDIDINEYSGNTYNIEVDEDHTYCVGENGYAVHNCSTQLNTGFGVPILSNIMDIAPYKKNTWLIADGGCKHIGDIAKAVYFGADFVMMGKMLAATDKALGTCYNKDLEPVPAPYSELDFKIVFPHEYDTKMKKAQMLDREFGNVLSNKFQNMVVRNLVKYKEYKGMASRDARKNLLNYASVEGRSGLIAYDTTTEQFFIDTFLRLQASLSYGGAKTWDNFRKNVKAVLRSPAGIDGGRTHLDVLFDK